MDNWRVFSRFSHVVGCFCFCSQWCDSDCGECRYIRWPFKAPNAEKINLYSPQKLANSPENILVGRRLPSLSF